MNTYFRAKLSLQIDTVWQNNFIGMEPLGAGNANFFYSLNDLAVVCPSWNPYRTLFTFYKPRGILIEAEPKFQNVGYFDSQNNQPHLPWDGNVGVGLFNNNNVPAYNVLADSNHFLLLSGVSKQRVYWHFTIKDFSEMPTAGQNPTGFPFYLCIAQNGQPNQNNILPIWNLRVTFYVTMRQANM